MKIKTQAIAGSLESSDVLVSMTPQDSLKIEISSPVLAQFGESIKNTVKDVMAEHNIDQGLIRLEDQGALDCTIRARLETCLRRANREEKKNA